MGIKVKALERINLFSIKHTEKGILMEYHVIFGGLQSFMLRKTTE